MRVALGQFHRPDPAILRYAAQLGVTGVQLNTPMLPGKRRWETDDLVALVREVASYGLTVEAIENVPRSFYDQVMFGGPERDLQLEDYAATIRHVGEAGVPLLGHHFTPSWVWRTSFDTPGRGGAHVTSFDLAQAEREGRVLVYKVDPEIGAHTSAPYDLDDPPVDETTMWANYQRFLDAVLPEAERAGVRLALHPADPPLLGLGGAARLFRDLESFERADALANGSPAWGLNLCLGCCSEMPGGAANVFRMIERFGPTGRIAYVHFRDVQGSLPSFRECFIGEGNYDPAEVVMALDAVGFDGFLLDDHVPHVVDDTPWGHRSRGYAVGYLQGLLRMLPVARDHGRSPNAVWSGRRDGCGTERIGPLATRTTPQPAPARMNLGMQRGDHVYATLLTGIVEGRYAPGAQLVIEDLAEALGVSITPVRDALARLENRGVVERVPYQGSYVRTFAPHEIQDLYEVRVGLEMLAVTLACSRITPGQLDDLAAHQRAGERALADGDLARYQACNHAFHAAILEASGNRLLASTMANISLQMQMMIAQTIKVPGRPDRASKEHADLIQRLAEGDVAGAETLMKRHVYGALEDLGLEPLT